MLTRRSARTPPPRAPSSSTRTAWT
jgi:hypothetical protein